MFSLLILFVSIRNNNFLRVMPIQCVESLIAFFSVVAVSALPKRKLSYILSQKQIFWFLKYAIVYSCSEHGSGWSLQHTGTTFHSNNFFTEFICFCFRIAFPDKQLAGDSIRQPKWVQKFSSRPWN